MSCFASYIGAYIVIEDLGKVLAGIQVPPADNAAFDAFLKELNYTYVEETNNPVYKRYLLG